MTWCLVIDEWPVPHTFGTSAGKPQGLMDAMVPLSAFLFLTSHLPDGSTLEQMPHSPEKPRKGVVEGVVASSCGSGSCWTRKERCDGEERAGRGELRRGFTNLLLGRADADSSRPVLWFSGLFPTELNSKWRTPRTRSCPGGLPGESSLSA